MYLNGKVPIRVVIPESHRIRDKLIILNKIMIYVLGVSMEFSEYQRLAKTTAVYPEEYKIYYPTMGLASEVGEVANKVKKKMRGDGELDKEYLAKEIGDILWYIGMVCNDTGLELDKIAIMNLEKLKGRKERGTLKGSGDDR